MPDGKPADRWQRSASTRHRAAELAEDAAELFAQGFIGAQAAQRLDVSSDAIAKALSRTPKATEREHAAQRARFAAASATAAAAPEYQAEAG